MKYLEFTPLDRINDFLNHINLGERTIRGCMEAYSCKHTGTDKKLSLSLENEILDHLGKSSDGETDSSAIEYLYSRSSRKTLVYLLLTLHHMYPDYGFSAVKAHEYFTEESWDSFKQFFDVFMFEASKEWLEEHEGGSLLEALYKALDEVVKLSECELYSYNPEAEADPLREKRAIWSYHFFFYNRKLKRVVSVRFSCSSNLMSEGFYDDELSHEENNAIFVDMDMLQMTRFRIVQNRLRKCLSVSGSILETGATCLLRTVYAEIARVIELLVELTGRKCDARCESLPPDELSNSSSASEMQVLCLLLNPLSASETPPPWCESFTPPPDSQGMNYSQHVSPPSYATSPLPCLRVCHLALGCTLQR
ncbi:repressor of RNA polymerase III transcriptionMAF1-like protein, partial [Striga asiatica]